MQQYAMHDLISFTWSSLASVCWACFGFAGSLDDFLSILNKKAIKFIEKGTYPSGFEVKHDFLKTVLPIVILPDFEIHGTFWQAHGFTLFI